MGCPISLPFGAWAPVNPMRQQGRVLTEIERSGVLALHAFLREHDPNHENICLKRLPTYTGNFLWLCPDHFEDRQSKIPDVIDQFD